MQIQAGAELMHIREKVETSKNKRFLAFPSVPVDYIRSRLNTALANPITRGGSLLQARIEFAGFIEGDYFEIEYASYGKSTMFYTFSGHIVAQPGGTRIELVTDSSQKLWQFIMIIAMGFVVAGFALGTSGFSGLALVFGTLLTGIVLAIVFFALNLAGNEWHKTVATNSVCELLQQIVYQRG